MYVHIGMSLRLYACHCAVARGRHLAFPSINLSLSFSDRSFVNEAGACGFSSILTNERERRTMLMCTAAVPSMATCTASNTIHVSAADLVSGPPACAATTLPSHLPSHKHSSLYPSSTVAISAKRPM